MTSTAAAITLTIPDNEARTAYSTLRRLGVSVGSLERAELLIIDGDHAVADVEAAVRKNESVFNDNMHALQLAPARVPARGELWILDDRPIHVAIGKLGRAIRVRSWRLLSMAGAPADEAILSEAADLLLCNPAVQRRVRHIDELPAEGRITR